MRLRLSKAMRGLCVAKLADNVLIILFMIHTTEYGRKFAPFDDRRVLGLGGHGEGV